MIWRTTRGGHRHPVCHRETTPFTFCVIFTITDQHLCSASPLTSAQIHSTVHLASLPQRIEPLGHLLHVVGPQQDGTLLPLSLLPPRPHELRTSHQWGLSNLLSLTLLLLLIWPLPEINGL